MSRVGEATQAPSAERILELDALRGIAALGVVFWHYGAHFHAYPLAGLLHPFYNAGFLLVDFFFVLSGYVIARAYWREPRQWNFHRNLRARVARLYPLHLLTLLATIALVACLPDSANNPDFRPPTNDVKHFALNLVLLNQVGLQDGWSFNTPAWSISAEFLVNIAFLAFISFSPRLRTAWLAAAIGAAILLVALSPHPYINGNLAFGYIDVNLARCSLGFFAGVGAYWLLHRLRGAKFLAERRAFSTTLGVLSCALLVGCMTVSGRHPPISHYLLSIVAAAGCVVFVPFSSMLRPLLQRRTLVYLGDISYSTYLTHYPIQLVFYSISAMGWMRFDFASPAIFLLFMAAVVLVSGITHRFVELPMQRRLLALAARKAV